MNEGQHIEQLVEQKKLIKTIEQIIARAKRLSPEELTRRGKSINGKIVFPQTPSEELVQELSHILLTRDEAEDNPILNEMTSIISQLDMDVSNNKNWQRLFTLADKLPTLNKNV